MGIMRRIKTGLEESLGNEVIGLDEEDIFRNKPDKEPDFSSLTEEDNSLDILKSKKPDKPIKTEEESLITSEKSKGLRKKKQKVKAMKPIDRIEDSFVDIDNNIGSGSSSEDHAILQFLGIPRNIDLSGLATPDTIEKVEFSLSVPSGINPDEVEKFLNYLQKDLSKLYRRIEIRENDFTELLRETTKLQNKLIDINQKRSMLAALDQDKSVIDKLKDEIVDLRMKNASLQAEVNKYEAVKKELDKMKLKEEIKKEESVDNKPAPSARIDTDIFQKW